MMKYYSAKKRNEVPIYAVTQLRRYLIVAPFCSYFHGLFDNFTTINLAEYYLKCLGFFGPLKSVNCYLSSVLKNS